jgi:hypothetical protein
LMGSTLHWGPDEAHDKWQVADWEKWVLVHVFRVKNCALNLKNLTSLLLHSEITLHKWMYEMFCTAHQLSLQASIIYYWQIVQL